jgi:class 3 adenylate cyclase
MVEKIKTIGPKIIFTSSVSDAATTLKKQNLAGYQILLLAESIRAWFKKNKESLSLSSESDGRSKWTFSARIGIYCGSAVSGIIGRTNIVYDVIGDAINCASR